MATKFKKLEAGVSNLGSMWSTLTHEAGYQRILQSGQSTEQEDALLTSILQKVTDYRTQLAAIEEELAPIHAKALEKDPDKQMYGEGMVKRILTLVNSVTELVASIDADKIVWEKLYEPVIQRKELQERLKHEEEVRRRQQEEEERKVAEKLRQEELERQEKLRKQKEERERLERLEQERIAEEKARLDRKLFEAERELRNQRKAEEERMLQQRLKRLEDAKTMDLDDVIALMENSNKEQVFQNMIRTLFNLLENIVNAPEDPKFRHVRKENDHIKRDLTDHEGGLEALMNLGFREKELRIPTNEVYYVMQEPNTETEMDAWIEWFDKLQRDKSKLESIL